MFPVHWFIWSHILMLDFNHIGKNFILLPEGYHFILQKAILWGKEIYQRTYTGASIHQFSIILEH